MSRARQVANFDPALFTADEVSGDKVSGGTIGAGVIGASVTGGAGLTGSTSLGTVTAGNLSNTAIVYPAGSIIGSARGYYGYTDDVIVAGTSEAFGPVVPLQLKRANAKILAQYNLDEVYHVGENIWPNVVYKSTSFTAAQGNTSHGGAYLNQDSDLALLRDRTEREFEGYFLHFFNQHSLGNSAGDTYYFAAEAKTAGDDAYVSYMGAYGSITLNIMELEQ